MDNTTKLTIGILSLILIISIIMLVSVKSTEEKPHKHHPTTNVLVRTPTPTPNTKDKEKEDAMKSIKKYFEKSYDTNYSSSNTDIITLINHYIIINLQSSLSVFYTNTLEIYSKFYTYNYIKYVFDNSYCSNDVQVITNCSSNPLFNFDQSQSKEFINNEMINSSASIREFFNAYFNEYVYSNKRLLLAYIFAFDISITIDSNKTLNETIDDLTKFINDNIPTNSGNVNTDIVKNANFSNRELDLFSIILTPSEKESLQNFLIAKNIKLSDTYYSFPEIYDPDKNAALESIKKYFDSLLYTVFGITPKAIALVSSLEKYCNSYKTFICYVLENFKEQGHTYIFIKYLFDNKICSGQNTFSICSSNNIDSSISSESIINTGNDLEKKCRDILTDFFNSNLQFKFIITLSKITGSNNNGIFIIGDSSVNYSITFNKLIKEVVNYFSFENGPKTTDMYDIIKKLSDFEQTLLREFLTKHMMCIVCENKYFPERDTTTPTPSPDVVYDTTTPVADVVYDTTTPFADVVYDTTTPAAEGGDIQFLRRNR